ncbi:MAG TPA: amidohydrolase family protein [candidate division Zixibacteria bacterium]|nr:amidohydrolase family protein [candidate division Zixibacteria bacterium]
MSQRNATRIIDGDGHVIEDNAAIAARMSSPYREIALRKGVIFPPLDHLHTGRAVETPPQRDQRPPVGPQGWLDFLDDVGIDWTVLYPTVALAYGKIVSLDYAVEAARAYNDWLYDTYLRFSPRFKGMALIPMQDPEEAAKELRRAVTRLGMLGAMMPSNGLPQPLGAKVYWPVYAEADRLGCCLAVHGGVHDRFGMDHMNMYVPVHALGHPWGLAVSCASILYNGIFDRFPRVRIAFLEGGVAWLLLLLERLHASHETHFQYIPPGEFGIREAEEPSDYLKKQIADDRFFLGVETEELTMPFAVRVVGNKPFLYSSDFPHEVTNESCKHDIGHLLESEAISAEDKAAMLHGNAERFYRPSL